ncbi:MAG: PTS system nitrogen regulatory IIA [Planctomycetota bacterium]|nr:MAG: PTS system nitrogen regulatory IIA [Planctomycetota bacterium]
MKLTELVTRESVVEDIQSTDKKGALREVAEALRAARKPTAFKAADVLEALLKREKMGTTGMGGGVALPHAKVEGLSGLYGAFGRSKAGVEYGAVDGERVHVMFMILSPPSEANAHLAALKRLSAGIRLPNMLKFLRAAKGAKEIWDLLREMDETVGA